MNLLGNPKLLITIAVSLGVQVAVFRFEALANLLNCSTLSWPDLLYVLSLSVVPVAFVEIRKTLFARSHRGTH
jgi:hypothetical protein